MVRNGLGANSVAACSHNSMSSSTEWRIPNPLTRSHTSLRRARCARVSSTKVQPRSRNIHSMLVIRGVIPLQPLSHIFSIDDGPLRQQNLLTVDSLVRLQYTVAFSVFSSHIQERVMVWIFVFFGLFSPVDGKQSLYPRHEATVVSVYDGDTMTVDVELWPGLTWRGKVRVRGVDTPEIQTKSQSEKRRALLARDFVRERIGKTVYLENVKLGNFSGRRRGHGQAAGWIKPSRRC